MKKTKVLSLLLAVFLLLSSLTLPLLAVDAETAEDPEQTQSDGADAAAADDSVPEDTVVEELRAGYMLKERVIRPSMVKVSK